MRRIVYGLAASAMLSTLSGCFGHSKVVILDPTVPHRVAKEVEVVVDCRLPDGRMSLCPTRVLPGYWIAGPPVVEASP
jgi:hypothetical protein